MNRLQGKCALITGGSGGIGAAAARMFVAEGAKVVIVDMSETGVRDLVASLGPSATGIVADVSSESDTQRYVSQALAWLGRIDVSLLNAGVEGSYGAIVDQPVEMFDKVIAVNVRGVWLGLSAVMPLMQSQGGGSIVVTSSIGGLRGKAGWAAYVTSKHAVIGLAKSAAAEGAKHGIRVNTVNPAPIDTRMIHSIDAQMETAIGSHQGAARAGGIPLQRYGKAEEVASMMLYLASDEASFCTGGSYLVDGGVMV